MSTGERCLLSAEELRWRCDPDTFAFRSTAEVSPLQEFVGQDRALRAIEFGLAVEKPGYNIFVTGLTGTGKASAIQAYLQRAAAARAAAGDGQPVFDWCYVHNFQDRDHPLALQLPRGKGAELEKRMENLLRRLRRAVPEAFAGEQYREAKQRLAAEAQALQQRLWQEMEQEAKRHGFALQLTPSDVAVIPLVNGQPATQSQILALSDEERADLEKRHAALTQLLGEAMQKAVDLQRETAEELAGLDKRVAETAVAGPFREVASHFRDLPQVLSFLNQLKDYTLTKIDALREHEARGEQAAPPVIALGSASAEDPLLPFRINVFVDNGRTGGPPIIIEHNPTFANLFGRIERRTVMGSHVTDHTMLKPGALALANGGYLVTTAREVFANPGVWDGIKRAVRSREVRLEEHTELLGLLAPQGLRPQPIPLAVKIILLGDNALYRAASIHDEDFWEMFKVKAEFDTQIERSNANLQVYASFIAACCETEGLAHFDRTGVAAVLEQAARAVGDQLKLSARFGQIRDLLIEADYWARRAGSDAVSAEHVRQAVAEKINRVNLVEQRLRSLIAEGVVLVDLDGEAVGQINGLTVYDLGDISFGMPARITARTFAGRAGVINIERESRLSGRIHDKGVLILSGYLGARFATSEPLSLAASLCFEQSYEGVDGDSASAAELYVILSSLSGLPIKQSLAVTGSINQKGEVQAIGGVNQKIEGFFDVCRLRGLTGRQGVIIPRANVRHLMLREDVAAAVAAGQFHVYAVSSVDEGIEILTGTPMGEMGADGTYPEGTVSRRVADRLRELAEAVRRGANDKDREKDRGERGCAGCE